MAQTWPHWTECEFHEICCSAAEAQYNNENGNEFIPEDLKGSRRGLAPVGSTPPKGIIVPPRASVFALYPAHLHILPPSIPPSSPNSALTPRTKTPPIRFTNPIHQSPIRKTHHFRIQTKLHHSTRDSAKPKNLHQNRATPELPRN
jgi:hypothetical protein